eukprot:scaffold44800_cov57-Phaeocystis_antarctica.AAC.1
MAQDTCGRRAAVAAAAAVRRPLHRRRLDERDCPGGERAAAAERAARLHLPARRLGAILPQGSPDPITLTLSL